jgi:hypothetical protein
MVEVRLKMKFPKKKPNTMIKAVNSTDMVTRSRYFPKGLRGMIQSIQEINYLYTIVCSNLQELKTLLYLVALTKQEAGSLVALRLNVGG